MTDTVLHPLDLPVPDPTDRSARAASLRSRAAVAAGDRDAWLALFAPDAVVADPVGPSMFDPDGNGHRGHEAIGAFWDAAINPNRIHMDIHRSNAGGNAVANVATVTTTLGDGSRAVIDVVAVYTVAPETGLITDMSVYWEMDDMRFHPAPDGPA